MNDWRLTKDEEEVWTLPLSGPVPVRVVHAEVGWPVPRVLLPKANGYLLFPLFRINDYEVVTPGLSTPEGLPKRSEAEILNGLLQKQFTALATTEMDPAEFMGFLVKVRVQDVLQYHMGLAKKSEGWTGAGVVWNFSATSETVFSR